EQPIVVVRCQPTNLSIRTGRIIIPQAVQRTAAYLRSVITKPLERLVYRAWSELALEDRVPIRRGLSDPQLAVNRKRIDAENRFPVDGICRAAERRVIDLLANVLKIGRLLLLRQRLEVVV